VDLLENPKGIRNELTIKVEGYFQEYFEGLRRYACTLLRDEDEAKDAVQSIFLKLWEKADEIDNNQSVKSYLYTSVYNHCLNIKRHQKVKDRHAASGKEPTYTMEDSLSQKEDRRRILAFLESLPPRCRKIFVMSRLDEKKYAEIASELGISVKTVEAQMGKALKRIHERT
jgi:RNA polymerase sigma-70 factor, ECF subfamily